MKKIKFVLLITFIVIACSLYAQHDNALEYGFQILEINSSPSMSGMGDTGALATDDGLSFMNNPVAGLFNRSRIITVSQNFWLSDINIISGGYSLNKRKYHWGFGFQQLSYGKMEQRTETGEIVGEFHPVDFIGTINYGYRLGATHYFGINTKMLYEKIHTASSIGFSADLGYAWATPLKDLKLYSAVKNLGSTGKMDKEKIDLPVNYEVGVLKELFLAHYDLAFDAKVHKSLDTDVAYNFGFQVKTFEILYLRGGYKINNDTNDLSFGIGIDYDSFNVDYAYLQMTNDFDNVHKISLSYKF
ncbi:MAG: PorV/PorQ family protein [Candidatus Cloacimonadales bacterium]